MLTYWRTQTYLGHTHLQKSSTISYKNKAGGDSARRASRSLVENTHEPLVSQELWEIVREVRPAQAPGRPSTWRNPVCSPDWSTALTAAGIMVLCRTEKMRERSQYHFRCSTYGKKGEGVLHAPSDPENRDLKARLFWTI